MNSFILPMDSSEATLEEVGGKGANLSRLTRAGFPVPPGFLIPTGAYWAFVQANDLQAQIVRLATDQTKTVEETSAAIRPIFEQGQIPPEIAAAISLAYNELKRLLGGSAPVAVRSSATAEDLPGASFAGQQDTYLNVCGEPAVLEAVKRCWASLWTARALDYRARQHVDSASVSLAVVVQAMVSAEAAGILFTANPLSGARDELAIDAAWGLGEAIVGGQVTPDHIVADKATGAIKQITIADKAVLTQPTASGTEERPVEERKRRAQVLGAEQVAELVKLGVEIEKYYGAPQDIEWCLAQGNFFIVQARPITTLPEPVKWESPVAGAKWLKDMQAGEWATEPLSPLGATTILNTMVVERQRRFGLQKYPWHTLINGWLYIRGDYQPRWQVNLAIVILRYGLAGTLNGHSRMRRLWPSRIADLDALEKTRLAELPDHELRARVDRLLNVLGWWWWEVSWFTAIMMLEPMFSKKVPNLADFMVLFRGNDSLLLEAERALRQAADSGDTQGHLAKFGHLVESADPIHLTLRESPELLKQHMAAARRSEMTPDERLQNIRRERAEAENHIRSLPGFSGVLLRFIVRLGQSYAAHADDAVFHFQRVLALTRYTLLEIGKRMASAGTLEKAENVFYLESNELWQARSDLKELVIKRRLLRESQKRLAPPSYIPQLSDPLWVNDRDWRMFTSMLGETVLQRGVQERNGKKVIVGTPGSPGRARGIARVITGPDDFHRFEPGDVLVAHATTPVWTPLFNIASAVVTEVGGPFCHAAIVAREFGIPLVDGALDAMQEIADGMPITVDGSVGIVYLE
ncbi:MAG TPA: PEP/pyruvate-binding domain-containing protein [Anaerolineales bacterium]